MPAETRAVLRRQLEMAWSLARLHLSHLSDDEALWEPANAGPRVRLIGGRWRADWPDDESYAAGVPTIAWVQWHMGMWWTLATDRAFGAGELDRADVAWPGSADAATEWLAGLHSVWLTRLDQSSDDELLVRPATWPLAKGTFADLAAWVNVELMKNAAEIGMLRFLFASRR